MQKRSQEIGNIKLKSENQASRSVKIMKHDEKQFMTTPAQGYERTEKLTSEFSHMTKLPLAHSQISKKRENQTGRPATSGIFSAF